MCVFVCVIIIIISIIVEPQNFMYIAISVTSYMLHCYKHYLELPKEVTSVDNMIIPELLS